MPSMTLFTQPTDQLFAVPEVKADGALRGVRLVEVEASVDTSLHVGHKGLSTDDASRRKHQLVGGTLS